MTEKSFTESVADLLEERGWSQRQLAKETIRRSDWGSSPTISRMLTGDLPASLEAMTHIARALQVDPNIWPDYRMALLRHNVNPAKVGWASAYEALRSLERD